MTKYLLSLLITVLFLNLAFTKQGNDDFKKINWLIGSWNRTNVKADQKATESWKKISSTEWHGMGVSIKKGDTTFVEKLKIVNQNKQLYYVADVPENKSPVYFTITSITREGFVCENPDHDFPKKIEYRYDNEKLLVTTSGDGKSIDFSFQRSKR